MIDDKGRLFGKVSIVDLFAIIVVGAVIAVVYFNVGASGRPQTSAEQAVYITFFHPALEDFTVGALEMDAPVINDTNDTFMGRVVGWEVGDSISFMTDIHGNEIATPHGYRSSVAIMARVYGRLTEGAVVLDGNIYSVGTEVVIWAGMAKTMLHISDIRTAN